MTNLSVLTERSFGGLQLSSVQDRPPFINMMIYGDPGAGKTVLAGSAEEVEGMSPVLVGDIEGGSYSLRSFYPSIDVVRIKSLADLGALYTELSTNPTHGYKTIILDSLTEIQRMVMGDIMREVVEKEEERDPDVPSVREWGKSGEQVRRLVRRFRDLEMNCIFTALLDENQDKRGRTHYYPMLPGKLKREVSGFMDIVIFMYTKQMRLNDQGEVDPEADERIHRFVLTSSTDEYVCKDRSNRLPDIMLAPTMQKLSALIQGE